MRRKLKLILLLPLASVVVLALVAISPIRRIRLGRIDTTRIGHLVMYVEALLCKAEAGLLPRPPACMDVFFYDEYICSPEIANQWRNRLHVFPFPNVAHVVKRILAVSGTLSRRHLIPKEEMSPFGLSTDRAFHRYRGHLAISSGIIQEGDEYLAKIAPGKPLVCFHVRDSSYLRQAQPGVDFSYHDYRDFRTETLGPAVQELSDRGFVPVRMGAFVDSDLPFAVNNVVDYARSDRRSDRMDLYLASRCAFWIGTVSGIMEVPFSFRRPLVMVNYASPLMAAWPRITVYEHSLWIFKKYWSESRGRFLSFKEILKTGVGSFSRSGEFQTAGIRFVDNSAEEIREVTHEMIERLHGTWSETAEDGRMQKRFWTLWGDSTHAHAVGANVRVGARFLSRNPELLS